MEAKQANTKIFEKEIAGKKYKAQYYGLRTAMRAFKACRDDKDKSEWDKEKLTDYIFENVIVDPPMLTIEDFDDWDELNAVVFFGTAVLNNNFRPEKSEGTKGRSKK